MSVRLGPPYVAEQVLLWASRALSGIPVDVAAKQIILGEDHGVCCERAAGRICAGHLEIQRGFEALLAICPLPEVKV